MNRLKSGYTLIELMITLVIALSILMLSVFTMSSYMPKQRLLDSVETTEQTLSRAQFEATSRSTWSCVKYDASTKMLSVFMDTNANHTTGPLACGDGPDLPITSQQLRDGVSFPTTLSATCNFLFTDPIWFNSAGVPQSCTVGSCNPTSYELILINSQLPSGNKSREVEVISSGMISIVKRNEVGFIPDSWATSGSLPNGCE